MLQIFSDASHWQGTAFAATLIFEDWSTQLAFFWRKYENIESCTVGEIMGVEQGLTWVLENRPDAQNIAIYADNLSVMQKLCDYVENQTVKQGAYPALWLHMYALCDRFKDISIYHIPSHQQEHNPNKACDILCSTLIRPYKDTSRCSQCTQS